jgi:hypothetical protein
LNIGGSATVTSTAIDFLPLNGGNGDFLVDDDAAGTGSFATGFDGEEGLIKDLLLLSQPVGELFSLSDFITFPGVSDITFRLTYIYPGIFTSAGCAPGGVTCTPEGSPFNLTNLNNGWVAFFEVAGFASDSSGDPESPFTGIFTTQESLGGTYQQALANINGGGSVTASYSAQLFVTPSAPAPIPEPGSVFLIGTGLLGLGFIRRRPS